MSAAFKQLFTRRFFPTEVYPLAGIVVIMSSAASFMVYHVSQDADVTWNHTASDAFHEWDRVKPDQDLKLYQRNPEWWAKYRASNPTHQGFLNTTTITRPAAAAQ